EKPPLWCLFGIAIYEQLAHSLPGDRAVVAVHVPFRYLPEQQRQPTIAELASRYVSLIRERQPHGPYHLLGLCFGGIVAHEAAQQLELSGQRVGVVTVLDALLPTGVHIDQVSRARHYLRGVRREPRRLSDWLRASGAKLTSRLRMRRRPEGAEVASSAQTGELSVNGREIDAAVQRFAVQARPLDGALLVVRASAEPTPSWQHVAPELGWRELAQRVPVLDIPATHLEILREPHVRALALAVSHEIDSATHASEGAQPD
ncbi:MAG: Peptide synthetase, partial [Myxococcaceae bacterium]|nr:Peptide synthetase [Myxococcaceae bacterium]